MEKVSVLIANYNNGKYFKDCYAGLIAQDYPNWEALILDDLSTDDSVAVIKEIIKDDSRFKLVLEDKNRGVGYAKGRLAQIADGDILAVLDPDDALKSNAISSIVRGYSEMPEAVGVYTGYFHCDAELKNESLAEEDPDPVNRPLAYWERGIGTVHHFFSFRRDAYQKTEGISPTIRNADDIDLYLKLEEVGPFYRVKEPVYLYRHARGTLSNFENASSSWVWVMRVLYQNGKRRVAKQVWPYAKYEKLILERLIFCMREAKKSGDKKSFKTIRKDFFSEPFNRKMFGHFLFIKYMLRHWSDLFWS
jgi:glycosyltransferase involved in cell wall biosynthesis